MATKPHPTKSGSAGKGTPPSQRAPRRTPRHSTKRDRLVRLLKADAGREIATLSRALGWLTLVPSPPSCQLLRFM